MKFEKDTISGWLLKYIIPIIIIPIMTSSIISYGATKSIGTQQINDGKRIDSIVGRMNLEYDQLRDRNKMQDYNIQKNQAAISKFEAILENLQKELSRMSNNDEAYLKELRKISSIVAVLKDREDRKGER